MKARSSYRPRCLPSNGSVTLRSRQLVGAIAVSCDSAVCRKSQIVSLRPTTAETLQRSPSLSVYINVLEHRNGTTVAQTLHTRGERTQKNTDRKPYLRVSAIIRIPYYHLDAACNRRTCYQNVRQRAAFRHADEWRVRRTKESHTQARRRTYEHPFDPVCLIEYN
jgi:hypothetical protein